METKEAPSRRELISLGVIVATFSWLRRREVARGVSSAYVGWRQNPLRMVAQLVTSVIIGQGVFWLVGYDQLGISMNPTHQMGRLKLVAEKLAAKVPDDPLWAWLLKLAEIMADFGKCPIEAAVYLQHGIVSDGVAAAVTQPWWSVIEGAEKLNGALMHPERVNTREQIALSIGCTIGSFFRYFLAAVVWLGGGAINRQLTNRIERGYQEIDPVIITLTGGVVAAIIGHGLKVGRETS